MECRLIDFNFANSREKFVIQLFGKNEEGKTCCIHAQGFEPFFYVKLADQNTTRSKTKVKEALSKIDCTTKVINKKKLYGFDAGKLYTFMKLSFQNTDILNRAKKLWYDYIEDADSKWGKRRILKTNKKGEPCGPGDSQIYESGIPPLLRFFHIQDISPSGWIQVNKYKRCRKKSTCDYECTTHYTNIQALKEKETPIPLKICSFDIEASSSHGDFPLAKKQYGKLVMDILDAWDHQEYEYRDEQENLLRKIILTAFGMDDVPDIHLLFPKRKPKVSAVEKCIDLLFKTAVKNNITYKKGANIQDFINHEETNDYKKQYRSKPRKADTIIDVLNNKKYDRGDKLIDLNEIFHLIFPEIEGDKVTFIGSTIRLSSENEPYLKHCVALGECGDVSGAEIESYEKEEDVLRAWTRLIQREDPDIIIGYNIFGFDFKFMLERVDELTEDENETGKKSLKTDFLRLSRERNVECQIIKSSLKIASGTHELQYVAMPGRILVDLYNYFRREVNLSSYKLDNVAAHFIGDYIYDYKTKDGETIFYSKNLIGLTDGNYIKIEMLGHSTEIYNDGEKFQVFDVEKGSFKINKVIDVEKSIKLRWCLAKDDVTPQDIFRLSNEGVNEKAIVAKYCIQDCNLVDLLLQKNDIITGFTEVASICSVPINFIVLRGQGIKLLSFIAKKCRMKNILMPDIIKLWAKDGYEGAICFPPKRDLYVDDPVAVVDYASLYPSSMISENISHDSKVWTKEYDLEGTPIKETGGSLYDNLEGYEYVDVEYDTYKYIRMRAGGREIKTKVGKKICRFAQYPEGGLAVMPSILVELLAARKATRVLIKYKTITTKDDQKYTGLINKDDNSYHVKQKNGVTKTISLDNIEKIEDTYNDFMKNVFDKRQLGYKITANSLYGQCGAKTSSFYDKDIAAATTATGRKLLIYAKNIIEEVYKNRICDTSLGKVMTKAEVVYGDTDSCFFTFNLKTMTGEKIVGKKALILTIEIAKEAGILATKMLKKPHDLEYEKTFWPFALLSKKRYVGMLYESDPDKCKRKSMGIVLKRRDNAPIVKDIYGGIIDILMKDQNIEKAVNFTKQFVKDMIEEKYPMSKLIISKSLRGFYKNPRSIAHKVLAERIGKRDPGNKPAVGSRIPYAYIQTTGKRLQGDKIENPEYIVKHKLKLDYSFYITNQILKPVQQIFALPAVLDNIAGFKRRKKQFYRELETIRQVYADDDEKYMKKDIAHRNKEVKRLIFEESLRKADNQRKGNQNIMQFFGKI